MRYDAFAENHLSMWLIIIKLASQGGSYNLGAKFEHGGGGDEL